MNKVNPFSSYKNIFITGGLGFIGSNFCHFLINNTFSNIIIYDNMSNGCIEYIGEHASNSRLKIIKADLLDFELLSKSIIGSDLVIHLAANADIAASAIDTSLDLKQTLLATYNVLEAMRQGGVKTIIYSSGSGVYGDLGEISPDENYGPMQPVSMYGATKLSAESLINAFGNLFKIKAYIFRFANVVGKYQTHGVAYDFIKKLRYDPNNLYVLGDGNQSKSYIHINDIISAVSIALSNPFNIIDIYNVGTSDYITVKEIAALVKEEMNLINAEVFFGDSAIGWLGDVPIMRFSSKKIEKIGWHLMYSTREALRLSIIQMLDQ